MDRKTTVAFVAMALALLASASSYGDSIWARRDKSLQAPYTDDVARRIGDTLTIVIAEGSKVDNKAKRDLQKETSRSGEFAGTTSHDGIVEKLPGFALGTESSNDLKSKADYKDERSFEDRVSVVVIDVLPNGNLVVNGTRDRSIAGDIQTIEVSGLVRPSDIAYDNTIKSQRVANFRIVTKNAGISAPYTRPGWLGRILDAVWPW
jgi:flagellar L-ring protein precursor FlgH